MNCNGGRARVWHRKAIVITCVPGVVVVPFHDKAAQNVGVDLDEKDARMEDGILYLSLGMRREWNSIENVGRLKQ